MIFLKVGNVSTFISPPLKGQIYAEFKKKLGYRPKDAMYMIQSNTHWDGWITTVCFGSGKCKCPNKKTDMHFPTGLLSIARDFFLENGIEFETIDTREEFDLKPISLSNFYTIRDYQSDVIMAGAIIALTGAFPACFFVTTKDLLYQAKEEFERLIEKNGIPVTVGVIGDGRCDIEDINVMTVQTAVRSLGRKYEKFDEEDDDAIESCLGEVSNKDRIKKWLYQYVDF